MIREVSAEKFITITKAPFQRNEGIHSNKQAVGIIASMINGYDIGTVTTANIKGKELLIDGLQRKDDISRFINGEFPFRMPSKLSLEQQQLYENKTTEPLKNMYFHEMPKDIQKKIVEYPITVKELNLSMKEATIQFVVLNGGVPINKTERDNTSAFGGIFDVINSIVDGQFFKEHQVVNMKIRLRMGLKKLVNDCMAHLITKEHTHRDESRLSLNLYKDITESQKSLYYSRFVRILNHIVHIIPLNKKNTFNSGAGFYSLFCAVQTLLEEQKLKCADPESVRKLLTHISDDKKDHSIQSFKYQIHQGSNNASNKEAAALMLKEKLLKYYH